MSEISLSMLPTPPRDPPLTGAYAILRHRYHAEVSARRAAQREVLQLKQEVARLMRILRKRDT
jgi:hypothetical protein